MESNTPQLNWFLLLEMGGDMTQKKCVGVGEGFSDDIGANKLVIRNYSKIEKNPNRCIKLTINAS